MPRLHDVEPSVAELEQRLEAAGSRSERLEALNELAWELRTSDAARAHDLAVDARALAQAEGNTLAEARACRTLTMTFQRMDDAREVFALGEEARRLFDAAGDRAGQAASRDFLASIHEFVGDYAGGLELALDALAIAQEIDDPVRQGYALSSIGGILAASGEPDEAILRLEEALELFSSVNDERGIGTIFSRMARVFADHDRAEDAAAFALRCLELGREADDDFLISTGLGVQAQMAEKQGELERAERLYAEALASLRQPIARNLVGSEIQVARARVLVRLGNSKDAERFLRETLAGVDTDEVGIVVEVQVHESIADIRQADGDAEGALEHLRKAHELRKTMELRNQRNRRAQIDVRTAIATAQKDAEIHRLRYVELSAMQSKLIESEKMASVGKLAAGTAHELNTPVGVLRSNLQLLERASQRLMTELRGHEDLSASVGRLARALDACRAPSNSALDRIAAIAESYRRFAELDAAERKRFDIREGIESALLLLEANLPEGVRVHRRLEAVPVLEGWPRPLNYAFMTVLRNAVEALDGPGEIHVETLPKDEELRVSISDSGRGMTPEEVAELFEVGFGSGGARTKIRLGLVAAQAAVERHGGRIEVQSEPGQGTRFDLCFPLRSA